VAVSSSFRTFVIDQLSRVIPGVRARSMFGGVGIYASERFFALIADDTLYLKVAGSNRPDFETCGMGPFRPPGEDGEGMQYYEVPTSSTTRRPCARGPRRRSVSRGARRSSVRVAAAPNKRLKLPAPGLGRNCVCAPTGSVVVSMRAAPAGVGAAA